MIISEDLWCFQRFYALTIDMLELMFRFGMSIKWSPYRNTGNTISSLIISLDKSRGYTGFMSVVWTAVHFDFCVQ